MVLGTKDIDMKKPLKGLFGRRERRERGLGGAPEEKPVPLFLCQGIWGDAWTASAAGKSCISRCNGISGHMVGGEGSAKAF